MELIRRMSRISSRILRFLQKMIERSIILARGRAPSPQLVPTNWGVYDAIEKRAQPYVYAVLCLQIIFYNKIAFFIIKLINKKDFTISFSQVNLDTHRILYQTRTCRS